MAAKRKRKSGPKRESNGRFASKRPKALKGDAELNAKAVAAWKERLRGEPADVLEFPAGTFARRADASCAEPPTGPATDRAFADTVRALNEMVVPPQRRSFGQWLRDFFAGRP